MSTQRASYAIRANGAIYITVDGVKNSDLLGHVFGLAAWLSYLNAQTATVLENGRAFRYVTVSNVRPPQV